MRGSAGLSPTTSSFSRSAATARSGAALSSRWTTAALLVGILIIAAVLRAAYLGQFGYGPDELWTAEIAMGRGSLHLLLQRNVLMPPPPVFDLHAAASWWHVWTMMQCTHPPLYFVMLRLWMNLLGTGDAAERMLSVVASVAAVAVLFDVVRLLSGNRAALWASLLMALAEPQIDHARMTRNYALLMLTALAAADVLVRIVLRGVNSARLISLVLAVLATLLTHYFCIGAVVALMAWGLLRTRGSSRVKVLLAFAAAAIVFALVWGPFMWRQRELFSTSDQATLFLHEAGARHVLWTLLRYLQTPVAMLVGPMGLAWGATAILGAALYAAPLLWLRRRPDLLLWIVWLFAAPGAVLLLDLTRQTSHLFYLRYTLLAGPPVYALLAVTAAAPRRRRWLNDLLPGTAAVACLLALPRVYAPPDVVDPHAIQQQFQPLVSKDTPFLFIGTGVFDWASGENYLLVSRYFRPLPGAVALLNEPASPDILQNVQRHPVTLVFTKTEDARQFVPNLKMESGAVCPGRGMMWVMRPPSDAESVSRP